MSIATTARDEDLSSGRGREGIVDADVHNTLASNDLLLPYLPQRWAREVERWGCGDPTRSASSPPGRGASPPAPTPGRRAAASPAATCALHARAAPRPLPIDAAILNPINQTTIGAQPGRAERRPAGR